jgi:hypothetical protein
VRVRFRLEAAADVEAASVCAIGTTGWRRAGNELYPTRSAAVDLDVDENEALIEQVELIHDIRHARAELARCEASPTGRG